MLCSAVKTEGLKEVAGNYGCSLTVRGSLNGMEGKGKALHWGLPRCRPLGTFPVGFHRAHVCRVVFIFHFAPGYLVQTELCSDFAQGNLGCRRPLLFYVNGLFSPSWARKVDP